MNDITMRIEDRRFSFEHVHKLDSSQRRLRQPPTPVVQALRLHDDSRVLDLGVGAGYFALPIARHLADLRGSGKVLALDVEPRMLDALAERAKQQQLEGQIERILLRDPSSPLLPLPDAVVSHALLANIYHELPDRTATLAEVRRVLHPDSVVLIVDWDPAGNADSGPPLDQRIAIDTVLAELAEAGFTALTALPLYDGIYAIHGRGGS